MAARYGAVQEDAMTQKDVDRVMLVRYAVKEAGPQGSLEQMKAICYCLRNRVRSGWGEWMEVIETADETRANEPGEPWRIDTASRAYQRLLHDVDDIYFGHSAPSSDGPTLEDSLCEKKRPCFHWLFLDRPIRQWFKDNIIADKQNHPSNVTMGLTMFFE
jgi:hypothetical protein